jgi:CO/xanthine dehydrogenase FAD-binding subunit
MVGVNRRQLLPKTLIYVGDIGWNHIEADGDQLVVGATTTHTELTNAPLVLEKAPLLAAAVGQIGSPAIRNMGTIGGNLVSASPAADGAVALLALGAEFKLVSAGGERTVPAETFFIGPSETVIRADELIKEVVIPSQGAGSRYAWYKLGQRKADVCGAISAAILMHLDGGVCTNARIALGAVSPTPLLATEAGSLLPGKSLDEALIEQAATAAMAATAPIDDTRATAWYRKRASGVIVKRLLQQVLGSQE